MQDMSSPLPFAVRLLNMSSSSTTPHVVYSGTASDGVLMRRGGGFAPATMTLMFYPIYHHCDVHVVRFSWKIGDDFPLTYIIVPTILPGRICININSERFRIHIWASPDWLDIGRRRRRRRRRQRRQQDPRRMGLEFFRAVNDCEVSYDGGRRKRSERSERRDLRERRESTERTERRHEEKEE